jgi:hypothetical protein
MSDCVVARQCGNAPRERPLPRQAQPSHNCCQHDSRFAAGLLKRGNEHANEDQLRQHTGDEFYPLQLAVVFETYTEPFGVVRQAVLIVVKFQRDVVLKRPRSLLKGLGAPGGHRSGPVSGASGGTLRNVVRCQLSHLTLLSEPAPCDTARRTVHG